MKKYLSGMLAIVLAIGFSAFTTAKKTLTYTFTLDRVPTAESHIEQTFTHETDGKLYFANWDRTAGLVICSDAQERGCTILVDEKYTNVVDGIRYLNAEDPDGVGTKIAFPDMEASIGATNGSTNYYKVNNALSTGTDIDVNNGSVQ
jgi:hypothetical protein